jgi:hypothetical protein
MFATTFWSGGAPIRIVPCGLGPVEVIAAYKAITEQIPAPLTMPWHGLGGHLFEALFDRRRSSQVSG